MPFANDECKPVSRNSGRIHTPLLDTTCVRHNALGYLFVIDVDAIMRRIATYREFDILGTIPAKYALSDDDDE